MNEKWKAILIGGIATGVLCSVPITGTLCFVWAVIGSGLAVYLYIQKSPAPVTVKDGAIIGAISGAIGVVLYTIIGLPIGIVLTEIWLEQERQQSPFQVMPAPFLNKALMYALLWFGLVVMVGVFSALGGVLTVRIFEKRQENRSASL